MKKTAAALCLVVAVSFLSGCCLVPVPVDIDDSSGGYREPDRRDDHRGKSPGGGGRRDIGHDRD